MPRLYVIRECMVRVHILPLTCNHSIVICKVDFKCIISHRLLVLILGIADTIEWGLEHSLSISLLQLIILCNSEKQ